MRIFNSGASHLTWASSAECCCFDSVLLKHGLPFCTDSHYTLFSALLTVLLPSDWCVSLLLSVLLWVPGQWRHLLTLFSFPSNQQLTQSSFPEKHCLCMSSIVGMNSPGFHECWFSHLQPGGVFVLEMKTRMRSKNDWCNSPVRKLTAAVRCKPLFLCFFLRGFIHSVPVFRGKGLGDGLSQSGKSISFAICIILSFMDLTSFAKYGSLSQFCLVWRCTAVKKQKDGGGESSEYRSLRKLLQIDTEKTEKDKGCVSRGHYSGEHSLTMLVATVWLA